MKKTLPPDRSQLPFDRFMDIIDHVTDLVFLLQNYPDPVQNNKAKPFVAYIVSSIRMFTDHNYGDADFKKWLANYTAFTNSHAVISPLHCI